LPVALFQLDDGFQSAIGDWLTTNDKFPLGARPALHRHRRRRADAGHLAGTVLAAAESAVARENPGWLPTTCPSGTPLVGMGERRLGRAGAHARHHPAEVLEHLESVARSLVEAGYPYLKLDFTMPQSIRGGYADPSQTPAQRVRAGFDAIRRGAGVDTFLLGCGLRSACRRRGRRHAHRADVAPYPVAPTADQYRPPGTREASRRP
jgi:alpha-galactosidase